MSKSDTIWLEKAVRWGLYFVAFVPLIIFSDYISPFHFGKVVIFRSVVELLFPFYLALVLLDKKYFPISHPIVKTVLIFTAAFGVTSFFSVNPYLSFWGGLERMGGFWTFLHYAVLLTMMTGVFTRKDWLNILRISVFVGFLSALYGFGQKTNSSFFIGSGGRARIFGTIGNAALFAGYQVVALFLGLSLLVSDLISKKEKIYTAVAVATMIIAVLMTAVRGSLLGLAVGLVVFLYLYTSKSHTKKIRKFFYAGLAIAILIFGLGLMLKDQPVIKNSAYLNRITDVSFKTFTVQTRLWTWQAGLNGWNDFPKTIFLGWGPETFNVPFSIHFNPKFFDGAGSETLFDRAHNMFIEVLVTMGLAGFLSYVAMLSAAVWFANKLRKNERTFALGAGLFSLLIAYMIHNSFIFDTSANFIAFFTALGFLIHLTPADSHQKNRPAGREKLSKAIALFTVILLIGSAVLIYKTNVAQAKANYSVTRGIVFGWNSNEIEAVKKFKQAIKYDAPGKYEYRHRYTQYLIDNVSGAPEQFTMEDINFAVDEMQKNIKESKLDYLPYLYLSRLYIMLGKNDPTSPYNDKALEASKAALAIAPKFVRTYYEVAQGYLNKKDYASAIDYFSRAIDLNPKVGISYWYRAATYIQAGDIEKGLADIESASQFGFKLGETELRRLVGIYLQENDYAKLVEVYEKLIKFSPNNPQYYASLAVAYAHVGRIDDAVNAARRAAELDVKFEPEARIFIESLGREF